MNIAALVESRAAFGFPPAAGSPAPRVQLLVMRSFCFAELLVQSLLPVLVAYLGQKLRAVGARRRWKRWRG